VFGLRKIGKVLSSHTRSLRGQQWIVTQLFFPHRQHLIYSIAIIDIRRRAFEAHSNHRQQIIGQTIEPADIGRHIANSCKHLISDFL